MKAYIITEQQKEALLQEMELEKFKAPNGYYVCEDDTPQQIAEAIHRKFHFIVCRFFDQP